MKITVILCTYNRAGSLARVLESLATQTLPAEIDWHVLVVDNNSRDKTPEVVEEAARQHPGRFRYLFEAQPGKSHALNAGIREADGEILAFIDDDVIAPATWLYRLTGSLSKGDYSGAGGRILADCNFSAPRWLPSQDRYGLAPLALFDLGNQAGVLTEAPFGTNMAFRKAVFEKYGEFRPDLGPRPCSEIRSEDTEFGGRLLAAGEQLWYEPSAVVYHAVPRNRLTKAYFLKWWFAKGEAESRSAEWTSKKQLSIQGIPLLLIKRFVAWTLRWLIARGPARRFSARLKVWGLAGQIAECYRQRRNAKSAKGSSVDSQPKSSVLVRQ